MNSTAYIYVDKGVTRIHVEAENYTIDKELDSIETLKHIAKMLGIRDLWLSSSMDFPEEYGWTRPESPRQFLNI